MIYSTTNLFLSTGTDLKGSSSQSCYVLVCSVGLREGCLSNLEQCARETTKISNNKPLHTPFQNIMVQLGTREILKQNPDKLRHFRNFNLASFILTRYRVLTKALTGVFSSG